MRQILDTDIVLSPGLNCLIFALSLNEWMFFPLLKYILTRGEMLVVIGMWGRIEWIKCFI